AFDLKALTTTGNLTVTAGGAVTDSGALVIPGTTTITATGQVVDLDHTSNNFATILFGSSSNAVSSVEVVDTNAIAIGASKSTGNFTVTAGDDVTDSGTVTVGGNLSVTTSASDGLINMGTLEVDGTVALTTNGNGAATIVNDVGLNFAASTVGGALSATATTGNVSQSGALTITGNSTLVTSADDATITLDDTGNALTGALLITTNDSGSGTDGDVEIDNGTTNLVIDLSTIDGDLDLLSGGTITDTGIATVRGTLTATTDQSNKAITLDQLAVDGAFTLAPHGTGAVTIVNDAGLNLAASTMGGTFSGTATTGNISDSGNLTITDAATFITTAAGSNIILDQSGSGFASTVTMQAGNGSNATFGNITFVDSAAVRLHSSAASAGDLFINASTDLAVGGNLSITATTGNITQGAAVTVSGTSSFETMATDADITLSSANALGGAVTLTTAGSGGNVTLDNGTTALDIAASSVGGSLTLTSGHASGITDSGTVTVGGDFAATTDANNGDIDMGSLAVTGTITLTTNDAANNNTGHATVVNATQVVLAGSSIDGNFAATATTGNITDSGALTVTGTSSFITSANNATITLDTTSNAFTGALTITTNDDTGTDADVIIDGGTTALVIAASTIDGDLTLTSGATAGITDTGTVTVLGDINLITDAGNGVIDMGTLAVTGSVDLSTHGSGDATLVNATALDFEVSTVGGDLTATATTGDITQSGQLDVNGTGTTTLTASSSGADIILFNAANDFEGAVSTSGADVKLWAADSIDLAAATVTGDYTVYAG
ncbi:MAG: S-layer family protein, partial [Gammaproteobacteria bacterium]|nr:S-layer family protein [Gammaproteobacteria bacterium]